MIKKIVIKGAKEHNLKNVSVEIPKDQFVVITGLSGSGKSSLAFDTIYAEGQRRYVESLSAYARQFLDKMKKPNVDLIEGLSPAIAIEQKNTSKNPRSTVATVTEIYDYMRVLFARAGIEMAIPFTAAQTLPALHYFDQLVDNKTGVSKMAQGLDPEVLKSATATSVAASMEGQAGQAEVIARNLVEGGMRRLFKLMIELYVKNTDKDQVMRMNGQFVPVDPRAWSTEMDLMVNVGIGTGREQERLAVLQMAFGIQQQLYQQYGPQNGLVTLTQIRNTMADIMALGGVRNVDRHFMPMTPEMEQQMLMQQQQQQMMMAQQQGQQADPTQALMQVEEIGRAHV